MGDTPIRLRSVTLRSCRGAKTAILA
jgi:hypothetical protein